MTQNNPPPPNPGGQPNSQACGNPNPPWWCEETSVGLVWVETGLLITALVIMIIIFIYTKRNEYYTRKRRK